MAEDYEIRKRVPQDPKRVTAVNVVEHHSHDLISYAIAILVF